MSPTSLLEQHIMWDELNNLAKYLLMLSLNNSLDVVQTSAVPHRHLPGLHWFRDHESLNSFQLTEQWVRDGLLWRSFSLSNNDKEKLFLTRLVTYN